MSGKMGSCYVKALRTMAACTVSFLVVGIAADNVHPAARSAATTDVINIVANINPFHQAQGIEHGGHGRTHVRLKWHRFDHTKTRQASASFAKTRRPLHQVARIILARISSNVGDERSLRLVAT